jgi:Uma2 family endonuclease
MPVVSTSAVSTRRRAAQTAAAESLSVAPGQTMRMLLNRLGKVAPDRVWLTPTPGTARQRDLFDPRYSRPGGMVGELIDGVLVEKSVKSHYESSFTVVMSMYLSRYLLEHNTGAVISGGVAYLKLRADLIRLVDLMYVRWDAMPGGRTPRTSCSHVVPELVVEVANRGKTRQELLRKREDLFHHGTKLFWVVDPQRSVVTVSHAIDDHQRLGLDDVLSGEDVLPGFQLSIREWFQVTDRGTRPPLT